MILDQHGMLVARDPKDRVIGDSFAYRDYFHGFGSDLERKDPRLLGIRPHQFLPNDLQDHERLHSAHLSDVYLSTATKHLQVTFTVPIWDKQGEEFDKTAIGILGISLQLQNLLLPSNAMMVQIRPDQLTGKPGLVISHPQLRPHTDTDWPPSVPGLIESAEQLKQFRLREKNLGIRSGDLPVEPFLRDFLDPVFEANTGQKVTRFAAFELVIIPSRPGPIADTGWLVIVTESSESGRN